jgi:hypothetical protein
MGSVIRRLRGIRPTHLALDARARACVGRVPVAGLDALPARALP